MEKRKYSEKEKIAYRKFAEAHAERSHLLKDCVSAFCVGGGICLLGQAIFDLYSYLGIEKDTVGTLVSCTLITLSCIFTGLGVYEKLARHAGAGTLVPITGFANAVSSAAIESRSEGFILGVGAKMFTIAGPVIVYGTAVSILYGVVYWLLSVNA